MTLTAMDAHYNTLSDDDVIKLLKKMEGRTEFDRGMILEAARRIEAHAAAVAEAVKAEREQCAQAAEQFECDTYEDGWQEMERGARHLAAVIRARGGEQKQEDQRGPFSRGIIGRAEKAYYKDEPPF